MKKKLLILGFLCSLTLGSVGLVSSKTNAVNSTSLLNSTKQNNVNNLSKNKKNVFGLHFNNVYWGVPNQENVAKQYFTIRFSPKVLQIFLKNNNKIIDDEFVKYCSFKIKDNSNNKTYILEIKSSNPCFSERLDAYECRGTINCVESLQGSFSDTEGNKVKDKRIIRDKNCLCLKDDPKTTYRIEMFYGDCKLYWEDVPAISGDVTLPDGCLLSNLLEKYNNKSYDNDDNKTSSENQIDKIYNDFLHIEDLEVSETNDANTVLVEYNDGDENSLYQDVSLKFSKDALERISKKISKYVNLNQEEVKKFKFIITDVNDEIKTFFDNNNKFDLGVDLKCNLGQIQTRTLCGDYGDFEGNKFKGGLKETNNFKFNSNHMYDVEVFYNNKFLIKFENVFAKEVKSDIPNNKFDFFQNGPVDDITLGNMVLSKPHANKKTKKTNKKIIKKSNKKIIKKSNKKVVDKNKFFRNKAKRDTLKKNHKKSDWKNNK